MEDEGSARRNSSLGSNLGSLSGSGFRPMFQNIGFHRKEEELVEADLNHLQLLPRDTPTFLNPKAFHIQHQQSSEGESHSPGRSEMRVERIALGW